LQHKAHLAINAVNFSANIIFESIFSMALMTPFMARIMLLIASTPLSSLASVSSSSTTFPNRINSPPAAKYVFSMVETWISVFFISIALSNHFSFSSSPSTMIRTLPSSRFSTIPFRPKAFRRNQG